MLLWQVFILYIKVPKIGSSNINLYNLFLLLGALERADKEGGLTNTSFPKSSFSLWHASKVKELENPLATTSVFHG